jgi:hypothetical protein
MNLSTAPLIENKLDGIYLISKRNKGVGFEYSVYKRISNPSHYHTVRAYKGKMYGMVGSEKNSNRNLTDIELAERQSKIEINHQKAYKAIHKAFPETKNGLHSNGAICLVNQ